MKAGTQQQRENGSLGPGPPLPRLPTDGLDSTAEWLAADVNRPAWCPWEPQLCRERTARRALHWRRQSWFPK